MKEDLVDVAEENRAFFWEKWIPKGKIFVSVVMLSLAGGVVIFQFAQKGKAKEVGQHLEAKVFFDNWLRGKDEASLEKLFALFANSPGLKKGYEASMARELIERVSVDRAEEFAQGVFEKKQNALPYHVRLGEISLVIEKQNFAEAFEKSFSLKEQMENDASLWENENAFEKGVYAYNLVRLGMLAKELEMKEKEMEIWHEVLALAGLESGGSSAYTDPALFRELSETMREGNVDLFGYIRERLGVVTR